MIGGWIYISKSNISVKYYYDWLVTQKLSYRKGEMREDRKKLFEQVILSKPIINKPFRSIESNKSISDLASIFRSGVLKFCGGFDFRWRSNK